MAERCVNLRPHEALAAKDGRLTVLVRAMKPQPLFSQRHGFAWKGYMHGVDEGGEPYVTELLKHCPLGTPGDVLIGREAFRAWVPNERGWCVRYQADNTMLPDIADWDEGPQCDAPEDVGLDVEPASWRSAAVMPRWAARHRLAVESVRIVQLRDLTLAECVEQSTETTFRGAAVLASMLRIDLDDWCWIARAQRDVKSQNA